MLTPPITTVGRTIRRTPATRRDFVRHEYLHPLQSLVTDGAVVDAHNRRSIFRSGTRKTGAAFPFRPTEREQRP
jgi:hypothetical protein